MSFNAISKSFKVGGKVSKMKRGGGAGGILLSNSYLFCPLWKHYKQVLHQGVHRHQALLNSIEMFSSFCDFPWNSWFPLPFRKFLESTVCGMPLQRSFFFPFNPTHLSWNFLYINFLHTHVPLIAVSSAKSQILNFPSLPAVMARGGVLSSLFCWGWNWMATIFLSWGESTQVFVT